MPGDKSRDHPEDEPVKNVDFYRASDAIRKQCDAMSAQQVEDLIELLRGDLRERVSDAAPAPSRPHAAKPVGK